LENYIEGGWMVWRECGKWEVGSGKCEAHGNLHVKGTESLHKHCGWRARAVTCVHSYYFERTSERVLCKGMACQCKVL
jgi:hypothetical protein